MVFRSSGEVTITSCIVLCSSSIVFCHFFQILDVIWTLFYLCEFRGESGGVNPDHPPSFHEERREMPCAHSLAREYVCPGRDGTWA